MQTIGFNSGRTSREPHSGQKEDPAESVEKNAGAVDIIQRSESWIQRLSKKTGGSLAPPFGAVT